MREAEMPAVVGLSSLLRVCVAVHAIHVLEEFVLCWQSWAVPFVWTRGRFSPGLITAILLFFPLGVATIRAGRPGAAGLVEIFGVGALLMATPILFLKLKGLGYFDASGCQFSVGSST